jgi:hypothetical protein
VGKKTNLKTWLIMVAFSLYSSGLLPAALANGLQTAKTKEKAEIQLPAGASAGWWAAAQENIRRSEYKITWQEETGLADLKSAYQAPNRAQELRTYFTPTRIRIVRRTETAPSWQWGVRLTRYGYAEKPEPVADGELVVSGNRIEYQRGGVIEWYVNEEKGLEQGFTLAGPPETNGGKKGTKVVLEMAVAGELEGRMSKGGSAVTFVTAKGEDVINYGALLAKDATGRELGSRIRLSEGRITLEIDASGAEYPVIIDPVITGLSMTADWTAEGNQNNAQFGYSVATAGDINGDGFSDVIVGAYRYDNDQTDEGRAFVYYGSAAGLSTTAGWTAESNQASAYFGYSVGTAGDINGDGFSETIVGAPRYDNVQTEEGAVFVWYGSASGLGANGTPVNADWTAESNQDGAAFGRSVSTAGDVNGDGYSDVIVGADWYDNSETETDEGWAFVYYGSASGLSVSADWTAESNQDSAYFGYSVGTAGDINGDGYADVIVGAVYYDNEQTNEGAAFVYYGSASGLGSTALTVESNHDLAQFGRSVSAAGDVNGDGYADVIVGAPYYDSDGVFELYEGAAFVYYGSASGLATTAGWMAEGDQASAHFGISVSTAGDVNGDGYGDVIVGAYRYETVQFGQTDEGAAFVFYGSASGVSTGYAWRANSDQAGAFLGRSVSTAGDVNGDGYADVIVGASSYDNGQTDEGAAFVYYGKCLLKADLTGDCHVDFFDFARLASDWLEPSLIADLTGEGFVNNRDLDVLAGEWLE